ncbi:MAG: GtrA family protein [Cyanothece sp. SIO1E1]|nr:GtrA family protein [Cyanothece sp. SIO1E1]
MDPVPKALRSRAGNTCNQLWRYFIVGGTAAIVDIGTFAVFSRYFLIDYRIALALSFSLGVLTNFSICNIFVFKRQLSPLWLVFTRHYLSSFYGLLSNEIIVILLVEFIHYENLILAKIFSTGITFINNFLIKKFYVYNDFYYKQVQGSKKR